MEIREIAERILLEPNIEQKLIPWVGQITDEKPGEAWRPSEPARGERWKFAPRKTAPLMPPQSALEIEEKRGLAHHIMANHELQALEVMAFVLCAFPQAPGEFRSGVLQVMADELRHTRMHIERGRVLGVDFGDFPVNSYFWTKAQSFQSVLDYVAGFPLVFEGGNLDHTLTFQQSFLKAGDQRSAALMHVIHRDEIEHVRFGMEWLRKLKHPHQTDWEAFCAHLQWPLRPSKARGNTFHREPRQLAGMTEGFIQELESLESDEPNRSPGESR